MVRVDENNSCLSVDEKFHWTAFFSHTSAVYKLRTIQGKPVVID